MGMVCHKEKNELYAAVFVPSNKQIGIANYTRARCSSENYKVHRLIFGNAF